jgi:uncharacterized protein YndB with AHSA1/START domain
MPRKSTRTLRNQYYVRAPPKKVFKALTSPKRLTRWFSDVAELSPRKGGRYLLGWTNGPQHTGKILRFVRGKAISFAWQWPGVEGIGVTRLTFSVVPKGEGSLVRVVHAGIPREARWWDLYAGAVWGWTYFLMNLKSVVETGHDLRSPFDG